MKKTFLVLGLLACFTGFAQQSYWQQEVNYNIRVALDDKEHSLKGAITLQYTNNAPEKLDYIWFHLWPNAYKNAGTAFAKQVQRDEDGKKKWAALKEKGYIDSLQFSSNGMVLKTEAHPEHIDILKVYLPQPLPPGQKITISTPFFVKLPSYASRSGHAGQSYMICQWYPKPAVYDRKGWHPLPYLDQGEFYSEFGTFDVSITLPSAYIVGATGTLRNGDELAQYREIGKANVQAGSATNLKTYLPPATATKTLQYKGENIHDFAWFADKDFVIRYDTMLTSGGKTIDVFTYHHPGGNRNWVNSTDYVKSGVRSYTSYIGDYAYPVVQAVEGPKNETSGGMEYPMITLITSPDATPEKLDAVITHEVGHNWFYGMLASNERSHAWLDEGLNAYYQFRYEAEKYKSNSIFGDQIPKEVKEKPVALFQSIVYKAMTSFPMEEAIETPSGDFTSKDAYGIVSYIKTAIWLYAMERSLGRENIDRATRSYFNAWKFRHPYPEDLKASFEKELGPLQQYFDLLHKKGSL